MANRKNNSARIAALASAFLAVPAMADVPYTPGNVPAEYAVVQPSASGTIAVGVANEVLLQFGSGGTGALLENQPAANASTAWSVQADGRLRVVPNAPAAYSNVERSATCPGIWFGTVTTIDHLLVRRLAASASTDQLEIATQYTTRYVDTVPGDSCAAPAPATFARTDRRIGFLPGSGQSMSTADMTGVLALPHRVGPERPEYPSQWSTALFDTRTGQISAGLGIQPAFTNLMSNGRLYVVAFDQVGTRISYEYRLLQRDYRGGDGLFAVATLPDGRRSVYYDYVPKRVKYAFPLGLKASWNSGFSETSTDPNVRYSIDFTTEPTSASPGLGSRRTALLDPSTGRWTYSATPFSWTGTSELVLQTFLTASGEAVAICPSGTTCKLSSARRLKIVSRFSDDNGIRRPSYVRLNVLETLEADSNGDGRLEVIDQRANFYQRNLGASSDR